MLMQLRMVLKEYFEERRSEMFHEKCILRGRSVDFVGALADNGNIAAEEMTPQTPLPRRRRHDVVDLNQLTSFQL